ncbi:MAG: hypothetical protein K2X93_21710 [Candidatus Obscuribacterales bacterium]|nr:hypothetical protein [Candidatus Obscuribacterales bacterium]
MWPKRKKGKARATKLKLKALQPTDDKDDDDGEDALASAPMPDEVDSDPISGVWKSKVLNNYKQNPKSSHTLLAKVPTGKAAFEAGERQKAEFIKDAMIKIVDRMFDNFQNTAYEFNQVTSGSDLELTWMRPRLQQEETNIWHENTRHMSEVFSGRISTRYWTLAVRGTVGGIGAYILPSDKLLSFSSAPSNFGCYLSIIPVSDGMSVDWLIHKRAIDPELFPSVYRALLDGLIRFASDEALAGETFRLEDIGFVQEAAPVASSSTMMPGYDDEDAAFNLLGQPMPVPRAPEPEPEPEPEAEVYEPRFIDNITNQVAQSAQSETDRFRESLQAPPFGSRPRTVEENEMAQEMRQNQASKQNQLIQHNQTMGQAFNQHAINQSQAKHQSQAMHQSQVMGQGQSQIMGQSQVMNQSQVMSPGDGKGDGEWKSVGPSRSNGTDWRQFMESAKEHIEKTQNRATDDKWNSVPGTEQLARPEIRTSTNNMSVQSQKMPPPYPSYGNAKDPPELLKPDNYQAAQAAQAAAQSQSGAYPQQQMPPQAFSQMGMPQQPPMMPPAGMPPGMVSHPGMPSMPGMINPMSGGGAMPPNMMPPSTYPNMQQPSPNMQQPPAMPPPMKSGMPGMPPPMVPDQLQSGVHQLPPQFQQYQQPYTGTGQHSNLPGMQNQFNTGAQKALPNPNPNPNPNQFATGPQRVVSNQFATGPQQQLPPSQFNTGPQIPAQYASHESAQTLQNPFANSAQPAQNSPSGYHPGPYGSVSGHPVHDPRAFQPPEPVSDEHAQYLLSESDFQDQTNQYPQPEIEEEIEHSWEHGEEDDETIEVASAEVEPITVLDAGYPQESFNELPVMTAETMARFAQASKAGFVFSSENDLVDAISVVLATIDPQIELLTQRGTEAFAARDFRRAESIIKLSERLNGFKSEAQAILGLLSGDSEH